MPHIFSIAKMPSTFGNLVFVYSTLIVQDKFDQLSLFNTDSSFWVCDNSATGHICKDKALFTGDLVPSIYEIGLATGILNPTLMGMVTLRLTDDEGEKTFVHSEQCQFSSGLSSEFTVTQTISRIVPGICRVSG
jgi:hypothetical protein